MGKDAPLFEQFFNTSQDVFFVLDNEGIIVRSNKGVEFILGYTKEKIIGKSLSFLIHADYTAAVNKEIVKAQKEIPARFETCFQTPSKQPRWLSVSTFPRDGYIFVIGHDITNSKNEYQKLRTAQDRLRLLNQTTSDPNETLWQKIEQVLELGRKQLNMDHGVIAEIKYNVYTPIKVTHNTRAIKVGKLLELDNILDKIAFTSESTIGVHDLSQSVYAEHPGRAIFAANAYIGIPILREGGPYGTLSFWSASSRKEPFDITDYDFMYSLASWVSATLALIEANESLAYNSAIVESSEDAIVAQTLDGKITLINKGAEKLLGYSLDEVLGESYAVLFPKESKGGINHMWKQLLQGEKIEHYTTLFKKKNGSTVDISLTVSPIVNEENEFIGFSSIARDITKEQEIDKAKTEFVSLASHQMRTPLSSILWYSELLLKGKAGNLKEKQKDFVSEIFTSTRRMAGLVEDLLNVSRIELGTFAINPEEVDLVKILKSVIAEFEHTTKPKHITIKENYRDVPIIQADAHLVRIIFQNLISNAIKYTPKKGEVYVSIDLLENNTKIGIEVHDTGVGIPKEQQDRVFSKLFRADNVRKIDTNGSGLGLYIVKSILKESGGSISFTSEENKGSTFNVILPVSGMEKREGTRALE